MEKRNSRKQKSMKKLSRERKRQKRKRTNSIKFIWKETPTMRFRNMRSLVRFKRLFNYLTSVKKNIQKNDSKLLSKHIVPSDKSRSAWSFPSSNVPKDFKR